MKSPLGLRLAEAKPSDATALLEASPTALLFGAWHSTGEGGGLGAKFARCLVSEIVAHQYSDRICRREFARHWSLAPAICFAL